MRFILVFFMFILLSTSIISCRVENHNIGVYTCDTVIVSFVNIDRIDTLIAPQIIGYLTGGYNSFDAHPTQVFALKNGRTTLKQVNYPVKETVIDVRDH